MKINKKIKQKQTIFLTMRNYKTPIQSVRKTMNNSKTPILPKRPKNNPQSKIPIQLPLNS
jgi:hypothetical protein